MNDSSSRVPVGRGLSLLVIVLGACSAEVGSALYGVVEPAAHAVAPCALPNGPISFADAKGPVESVSAACVPSWTEEQLESGFAAIRDTRVLTTQEQPSFLRRIPWLSVISGCEERALASLYYLALWGYPMPYFVHAHVRDTRLGDFAVRTENEPDGEVNWSGHVAPVVQVGGQLIVLDPALDPHQPLALSHWLSLFSQPDNVEVAVCRDHEDGRGCFDATPRGPEAPMYDPAAPTAGIYGRLFEEWRVQEMLGRDPHRSLGECPPWIDCALPEPTGDPARPPSITRLLSSQYYYDYLTSPLYVVGNNYIPGLTTLRVTGAGVDSWPTIETSNLRRMVITEVYDPGTYQVTALNGALASEPVTLVIE